MVSYGDAGVSIDNGNAFAEVIKLLAKKTFSQSVIGGIGSFAGVFRPSSGYEKPVTLGAADGAGTRLRLVIDAKRYDTIGQDLAATCANDSICNFATPLFFLDHHAAAKLEVEVVKAVVEGIAKGCKKVNCALIGGETAEMPEVYVENDFDLAGFAVGIVEEEDFERSPYAKNGGLFLALLSSGLHSNGYPLVGRVPFESLKMRFDDKIEGRNLIDILLEPTRIYVKDFLALKPHINVLAYVTGGGLVENLPRALPRGVGAVIGKHHLKTPETFHYIGEMVEEVEMHRSFNMGVGSVFVVSLSNAFKVFESTDIFIIGGVIINEDVILERDA